MPGLTPRRRPRRRPAACTESVCCAIPLRLQEQQLPMRRTMSDILRQVVDVRTAAKSSRERTEWSWSSARWTAQFHSTQSIWCVVSQQPFCSSPVTCGHLQTPHPRATRLTSLWTMRDSEVLRGILQPLVITTATALAAALLDIFTGTVPGRQASKSLVQMHSLLGGALSLLLVFR